jgi:hypothetical protein
MSVDKSDYRVSARHDLAFFQGRAYELRLVLPNFMFFVSRELSRASAALAERITVPAFLALLSPVARLLIFGFDLLWPFAFGNCIWPISAF